MTASLRLTVITPRLLTEQQAADYCSCQPRLLRSTGIRQVVLPNNQVRYDSHDLDAWIDGLKSGDAIADIVGRL